MLRGVAKKKKKDCRYSNQNFTSILYFELIMIYIIIKYFMMKFKHSILVKEKNGRPRAVSYEGPNSFLQEQQKGLFTLNRYSLLGASVGRTFPHLKHWLFYFLTLFLTEG